MTRVFARGSYGFILRMVPSVLLAFISACYHLEPPAEKGVESIDDLLMMQDPATLETSAIRYIDRFSLEATDVFLRLSSESEPAKIGVAWRLAAKFPSEAMRRAIEQRILHDYQRRVAEQFSLHPEAGPAIVANKVDSAYSFLRPSLMITSHFSFVEALAALAPERASDDLLTFVKKVHDTRHQSEVAEVAVKRAFEHMDHAPPSITHPQLYLVFLYASDHEKPWTQPALSVAGKLVSANTRISTIAFAKLSEDRRRLLLEKLATVVEREAILAFREEMSLNGFH